MPVPELVLIGAAAVVGTIIITQIESLLDYMMTDQIFVEGSNSEEVRHSPKYRLCPKDSQYVEESRRVLFESFGSEKPVDALLNMGAEGRLVAIKKLIEDLKDLYDVPDIKIELFYDKENYRLCGGYSKEENRISLNLFFLMTDNRRAVKEVLDTVFHEFRHAVQWRILMAADENGYKWFNESDMAVRFASGLTSDYISFREDPEGYYNQFVELDAREIALYVLEGV